MFGGITGAAAGATISSCTTGAASVTARAAAGMVSGSSPHKPTHQIVTAATTLPSRLTPAQLTVSTYVGQGAGETLAERSRWPAPRVLPTQSLSQGREMSWIS